MVIRPARLFSPRLLSPRLFSPQDNNRQVTAVKEPLNECFLMGKEFYTWRPEAAWSLYVFFSFLNFSVVKVRASSGQVLSFFSL